LTNYLSHRRAERGAAATKTEKSHAKPQRKERRKKNFTTETQRTRRQILTQKAAGEAKVQASPKAETFDVITKETAGNAE
jgi:hypothetical protein